MKKILSLLIVFAMLIAMMPAVFATEAETKTYTKITSMDELTSGEYVLVCSNDVALGQIDGTWVLTGSPVIDGDVVTDAAGAVWTLTVDGTNVQMADANGTYLAPKGGNNNGIATTAYDWAVSCTDGMFTFAGQNTDTVVLASNTGSENKFRGYKTTTVSGNPNGYPSTFALYKLDEAAEEEPAETGMVLGANAFEVIRGAGEPDVQEFVATQTGTLYIVLKNAQYMSQWSTEYSDTDLEYVFNYSTFDVDGAELSNGIYGSIEVVEGETYTFTWTLSDGSYYSYKMDVVLGYDASILPVPGVDVDLQPTDLPRETVEIAAGATQLYMFSSEFNGYVLRIEGEDAYISFQTYDYSIWDYVDVLIEAVDGVVEYEFSEYYMFDLNIGNAGDEAATFQLSCYAPLGGEKNPIIVENLDDIECELVADDYDYIYFQWTADCHGYVRVDVSSDTFNPYIRNLTTNENGFYENNYEVYGIYFEEGDVLQIQIAGQGTAMDFFFVEYYTYEEAWREGSEKNPYEADLMEGLYIGYYNKEYYYTWTPDFTGKVTLDFTYLYGWSTNKPTITINGETVSFGVINKDGSYASQEYTEIEVTAGETVTFVVTVGSGSVYGTLTASKVLPAAVLGDNAFATEIGVADEKVFTATETGTLYVVMSNLMYMPSWSTEYYESYYASDFTDYTTFTFGGEALAKGTYGSFEVVEGEKYVISWMANENAYYPYQCNITLSYDESVLPVPGIDLSLTPADLPMYTVEIAAGETQTYLIDVGSFEGYMLRIYGENAYVSYQYYDYSSWDWATVTVEPVDGMIELDVAGDYLQEILIGNSGAEAASFELDCYAPYGGIANPIIVEELDDIYCEFEADSYDYTYFQWTADCHGYVSVDVSTGLFYLYVTNLTTEETGFYKNNDYDTYYFYFEEGDVVQIQVCGQGTAMDYFFEYTYEEAWREGSDKNPIVVDLMAGVELKLYNESNYYTWTPDFTGKVTLDFTYLYSWSSNVPVMMIGENAITFGTIDSQGNVLTEERTEIDVVAGEAIIFTLTSEYSSYGTLKATEVEAGPVVLGEGTLTVTEEDDPFWGVSAEFTAPGNGIITVTLTTEEGVYVEYQVNVGEDDWGVWYNTYSGDPSTMDYEVAEGDPIELSVCVLIEENGWFTYDYGTVNYTVVFTPVEGGEDDENLNLVLGENDVIIESGAASSPEYIFTPESDGTLTLDLTFLQFTYEGTTTDVTAEIADYLAAGNIGIFVDGVEYNGSVTVTAGTPVIITLSQSRMGQMYGYSWDATLNLSLTEGGELPTENLLVLGTNTLQDDTLYSYIVEANGTLEMNIKSIVDTTSSYTCYESDMGNGWFGVFINGTQVFAYANTLEVTAGDVVTIQINPYDGCVYVMTVELIMTADVVPVVGTMGDANGDEVVNHLDAMLVAQYYVGAVDDTALTLALSDVNGDDAVNHLDAMMIAQFYVGQLTEFPNQGGNQGGEEEPDANALVLGDNDIEEDIEYTFTAEEAGTLIINFTSIIWDGSGSTPAYGLNSWVAVYVNGTAVTQFYNTVAVEAGDVITISMDGLDGSVYTGTVNLSYAAPSIEIELGFTDMETYQGYVYTAEQTGTLYVTVTDIFNTAWQQTMYNEYYLEAGTISLTVNSVALTGFNYSLEVTEGDRIEIMVSCSGYSIETQIHLSYEGNYEHPLGSDKNPVVLSYADCPTNTVEIAAGSTAWYDLDYDFADATIYVYGENAYILINQWGSDVRIDAVDGVVTYAPGSYYVYSIEIGNAGEEAATFAIEAEIPAGKQGNPIVLQEGDNAIDVIAWEFTYTTWTATEAGTVSFTFSGDYWYYYIYLNGSYNTDGKQTNESANPVVIEVAAGDVISVQVKTQDANWNSYDATLGVNVAFEAAGAEEDTITIHVIAYETFENVYAYTYNAEQLGTWPGTLVEDGTIVVTADFEGFIVNNGNGMQTDDIMDIDLTADEVWVVVNEDLSYALYYNEEDVVDPVATAKITIHVIAENWDNVYIYTWEPPSCGNWPGTLVEGGSIEVAATFGGMLLHNGNGTQTSDITDIDLTQPEVWITVNEDNSYSLSYVEPPYTIADGEYIISYGEVTFAALGADKTYGYAPAGDINDLTDADYITITNVGDGQFTMQDCHGRYIYMTGSFNSFNVSADLPTEGHLWILEETEGGLMLKNVLKEKYISYSAGYGTWGSYAEPGDNSVLTLELCE